jgi:hypothetical protein
MAEDIEERVARHYARSDLEQTILEALIASGKDPDRLAPVDLAPVDEFHTGGRQATIEFAAQIDLMPTCTSWTSAVVSAAPRAFSPRSAAAG